MSAKYQQVSDATVERVYEALVREADMDGIAIIGREQIGRIVGLSGMAAWFALELLIERGRIARVDSPLPPTRGNINAFQVQP